MLYKDTTCVDALKQHDAARGVGVAMDLDACAACKERQASGENTACVTECEVSGETHACVSFGFGAMMKKTQGTCELTKETDCAIPEGMVGGGKMLYKDTTCVDALKQHDAARGVDALIGLSFNRSIVNI